MPLRPFSGSVFNIQTFDDPIIKRLAQENKADIFATETAVSAIMTATKSVYSWDVIIKKYQDKVFIDKRDEENILDLLTVNETSLDNQPTDDDTINGVRSLMTEASEINKKWLYEQYSKDQEPINLAEADPFLEDEHQVAARMGYFYKIFKLGKHRRICIRSSVHSYIKKDSEEEPTYQNVYALNEYVLNKTNWKANLDVTMAQCLTKEV